MSCKQILIAAGNRFDQVHRIMSIRCDLSVLLPVGHESNGRFGVINRADGIKAIFRRFVKELKRLLQSSAGFPQLANKRFLL